MRNLAQNLISIDYRISIRRNQIQPNRPLPAALPSLPMRFLKRHIQPGQRVIIPSAPRNVLSRRQRSNRIQIRRLHKLSLPQLALLL